MLGIKRRYAHVVFGVIQSGLTCLVAAAIASGPSLAAGRFFEHWLLAWVISWATMVPVVVLAAPAIRSLSERLTRE